MSHEAATPVAAGAEGDQLVGIRQLRMALVVLTFQRVQIDEDVLRGGLPRQG